MSFRALYPAGALVGAAMVTSGKKEEGVTEAPSSVDAARTVAFSAGADVHDSSYYGKCMVGGIMSCGITHTALTPVDVVKCRMQTNPEVYTGMMSGMSRLSAGGVSGMTVGWLPTAIGYSAQGFFKFGGYEIFKDVYGGLFSPEDRVRYRDLIYIAGSASAEFIADVALVPWEAVKVRMQTSLPEANFPTQLGGALSKITSEEGMGGLFKSLPPLWGRQVPYTVVKFLGFERVVEAFYTHVFTKGKDAYSKATQLGVTFASGYIAGVMCAIVSHPADTIVSKLNQNDTATIGGIVKEMGLFNLATKGLGPRIFMIGTLTGLQWWIYDTWKTAVGLKTSGGVQAQIPTDDSGSEGKK